MYIYIYVYNLVGLIGVRSKEICRAGGLNRSTQAIAIRRHARSKLKDNIDTSISKQFIIIEDYIIIKLLRRHARCNSKVLRYSATNRVSSTVRTSFCTELTDHCQLFAFDVCT